MSIFPASPGPNQEFTSGGVTWRWDGRRWVGVGGGGGEGTITGVSAGVGLGGGGPSGPVTLYLLDTPVSPGSYTNTNLSVDQQGRITHAASGEATTEGEFIPRGTIQTISWGVQYRDDRQGGLPTLQEYLDAHVNGRWYEQRPGSGDPSTLTINNTGSGIPARMTDIVLRNLWLQNLTLMIISSVQFAGNLTIMGAFGGVEIGGTNTWPTIFASNITLQNVTATAILSGGNSVNRFNNVSVFGCPDVRFDPGWDNQTNLSGTLTMQGSNVRLEGQGSASHSFAATDMDAGSQLDISSTLGGAAVQLGGGRRQGWVLDRRTNRALDTFMRAGEGSLITSGDVSILGGHATVTGLRTRPVMDAVPAAGWGLMWTANGWAPGQFLRAGDWIQASHSTVTPISYHHEGTTHNLGASTVQGALQLLFQWFITDVQPPPEPPPQQSFHSIALSSLSFPEGTAPGTTVATISVAMSPATPEFTGSLALSGANATSFQIQGSNLVTVGTQPAGVRHITITATQSGITGSRAEDFTITVQEAGTIPALPTVPSGQIGFDFQWYPGFNGGYTLGSQTWTEGQPSNITVAGIARRVFVRVTVPNNAAAQGAFALFITGAPSGQNMSDPFALNTPPGLYELTGINSRTWNPGMDEHLYFRLSSGTQDVSEATARVFYEPLGTNGGIVPQLPAVPAGQTGHDFSWVPGVGTIAEQTSPQGYTATTECRVTGAFVRLTTSNATPINAYLGLWSQATQSPSNISNGFALNQSPTLITVSGISSQTIYPNDIVYWRQEIAGATTSAATARIFIEVVGGGPPPLPAVPSGQFAIDMSWIANAGTLSTQTMPPVGNITQNCRLVGAAIRITGTDTVASAAAIRWLPAGAGAAVTMSDLMLLNVSPQLVHVTGVNTTQVIQPGAYVYWGVMSEGILNQNSVATARIFLQPA